MDNILENSQNQFIDYQLQEQFSKMATIDIIYFLDRIAKNPEKLDFCYQNMSKKTLSEVTRSLQRQQAEIGKI